jgi:hypothetical protein
LGNGLLAIRTGEISGYGAAVKRHASYKNEQRFNFSDYACTNYHLVLATQSA